MKYLITILVFVVGCIPENNNIVFDQTHNNRWKIEVGEGYAPLRELLEGEGYTVTAWNDPLMWFALYSDVDILVEAMPQIMVNNSLILNAIESWVEDGGVLLVITDHKSFPFFVNTLLARFGSSVLNVDPIIGNGIDHCPPGITLCTKGSISYLPAYIHPLFSTGVEYATTWAGSIISSAVSIPILTLDPNQVFTIQGSIVEVQGSETMSFIHLGEGGIMISAEAAMWTCNNGSGAATGWCEGANPDGQFNDKFILNVFKYMSWIQH